LVTWGLEVTVELANVLKPSDSPAAANPPSTVTVSTLSEAAVECKARLSELEAVLATSGSSTLQELQAVADSFACVQRLRAEEQARLEDRLRSLEAAVEIICTLKELNAPALQEKASGECLVADIVAGLSNTVLSPSTCCLFGNAGELDEVQRKVKQYKKLCQEDPEDELFLRGLRKLEEKERLLRAAAERGAKAQSRWERIGADFSTLSEQCNEVHTQLKVSDPLSGGSLLAQLVRLHACASHCPGGRGGERFRQKGTAPPRAAPPFQPTGR
jgi:hypothetical protein